MTPPAEEATTLPWRVGRAERAIEKLEIEKADVTTVDRLADAVDGLRKALIGFMATVAGSAIVVSFTLLVTHVGSSGGH